MAKRILIIQKEHEAQTLQSVTLLPLSVQRQLALYDLTLEQFLDILNSTEDKETIKFNLASHDFFVVPYEDNYINVPLASQEVFEIESDNLFLSILRQEDGYNVNVSSVSARKRAEEENEEHDPVFSAYFSDDELK